MRARLLLLVLSASSASSALEAQDFSVLDATSGQALFERNWLPPPASTAATDGLGPYYNARSCAACHPRGGAGANTLEAMNLIVGDPVYGEVLQLRAVAGMRPEVRAELARVRGESIALDAGTSVQLSMPQLELSELQHGQPAGSVSLRRAPALGGLALLEQAPLEQIAVRADPHDRDGDGVSGKVAEGRFGWKATTASLREQVARALSLDLGLGSPVLPSAAGDCTQQQAQCHDAARMVTGDEFEAPDVVLDLLVAYLASLPPPTAPAATGAGVEMFSTLGCASCHVPQLQAGAHTLQAFSDLLLHDLGPGLAAGADSEWRTAPLWGLSQMPHFLHDGRAASLEEAVLWHGGEAAASQAAYRKLNAEQRAVLHAWLLGL
jgi:CxxC motif-containing protein (DUF1111 family)